MFITVLLNFLAFMVVFVMTCMNLNDFNTYECKGKTVSLVGEDADDITKAELVVVTVLFVFSFASAFNSGRQYFIKNESVSPFYIIVSSSILIASAIILIKASQRYKEIAEGCSSLEEAVDRNDKFFMGMIILIIMEALLLIGTVRSKKQS